MDSSFERGPGPRRDAEFPTLRAWFVLLNHEQRLGTSFLLLVLGAMFGIFPAVMLRELTPLVVDGAWAHGTVVGREPIAGQKVVAPQHAAVLPPQGFAIAHGGRRGPSRFVRYEFQDSTGRRFSGRTAVGNKTWSNAKAGDTVDVRYVTSDPEVNRMWTGLSDPLVPAVGFGLVSVGVLGTAITLFGRGLTAVAREVRLLADGVPSTGCVTALEPRFQRRRLVFVNLSYDYDVPKSATGPHERLSAVYAARGRATRGRTVGERVPVVHDRDDPRRATLDLFGLRTTNAERLPPS